MKSRNLDGTIIKVTAPATADTLFSVAHELNRTPRGMMILQRLSPSAQLYRPKIVTGVGAGTNLTGAWEFEGGVVADSTLNALTLTNSVSPVTNPAGKVGSAANFVAASSQFLLRASEANLQTGDIDYTLAVWANMATITGDMCLVSKDNNTANTREYNLSWNPTIGFYFRMYKAPADAMAGNAQTGIVGFSALTWYLVIAWHDSVANTINIQVNDSAIISNATTGAQQAASNAQFQIGARQYATSRIFWNGVLDQVIFWKRILTSTERAALYNAGSGVTYAQILAPYSATDYPWDATYAYIKSSVANAQFYVLFFN